MSSGRASLRLRDSQVAYPGKISLDVEHDSRDFLPHMAPAAGNVRRDDRTWHDSDIPRHGSIRIRIMQQPIYVEAAHQINESTSNSPEADHSHRTTDHRLRAVKGAPRHRRSSILFAELRTRGLRFLFFVVSLLHFLFKKRK
jgi:hypothetical protein